MADTWPDVLTGLIAGDDLSAQTVGWAMDEILAGNATPVQLAGTCSSLAPLRLDAGRFSLASRFDLPKYRRLHCPQSFRPGCYRPRLSG